MLKKILSLFLSVGLLYAQAVFAGDSDLTGFNAHIPGNYQETGFGEKRDYAKGEVNEYIDPFTGGLKRIYTDYVFPANGGMDIAITRVYNNLQNAVSQDGGKWATPGGGKGYMGPGWDLHFGRIWLPMENIDGDADILESRRIPTLPETLPAGQTDWTMGECYTWSGGVSPTEKQLPVLELPDGSRQVLYPAQIRLSNKWATSFITKNHWLATCLPFADSIPNEPGAFPNINQGGLVLYSPAGLRYVFNKKGNLTGFGSTWGQGVQQGYVVTEISDLNGNKIKIDYERGSDSEYVLRPTAVSSYDSGGALQHSTSFNYSSTLLQSITGTANGQSVKIDYGHDASQLLRTVSIDTGIAGDQSLTWNYDYTSAAPVGSSQPKGVYSLGQVTSPTGQVTHYGYDTVSFANYECAAAGCNPFAKDHNSVVVVSTRTVDDVVWSYDYTPGEEGENDITTASATSNGKSLCTKYEHIGEAATKGVLDPAENIVRNKNLYRRGLLVKKSIYDGLCSSGVVVQTEDYLFDKKAYISSTRDFRPYPATQDTYVWEPLQTQKTITRYNGSGVNETYETDYAYSVPYGKSFDPSSVFTASEWPGSKPSVWLGNPVVSTTESSNIGGTRITSFGDATISTTSGGVRPILRYKVLKSASQVTDGGVNFTNKDYFDGNGRVIAKIEYGVPTVFERNSAGDLTKVAKWENLSSIGCGGALNFDTNLSATTNCVSSKNSGLTLLANYQNGVPTKITQPDGVVIDRVVDSRGNTTSETVSKSGESSSTTGYGYDNLNRVRSIITPRADDANVAINYPTLKKINLSRGRFNKIVDKNTKGQVILSCESATDAPNTVCQNFSYDPLINTQIFVSDKSFSASETAGVSSSYDALGRLLSEGHTGITPRTYTYNSSLGVVRETKNVNGVSFKSDYKYASYGNPDERYLINIDEEKAPGQFVTTTLGKNSVGRLNSVTQGGKARQFLYEDTLFRPMRMYLEQNDYLNIGYCYDYNGKPLRIYRGVGNFGLPSQCGITGLVAAYTYDKVNRPNSVSYSQVGAMARPSSEFMTYDKFGNLLSKTQSSATLSSAKNYWQYVYDENNNLKTEIFTNTETDVSANKTPYVVSYAYDDLDGLQDITYPNTHKAMFSPDGFGHPTLVSYNDNTATTALVKSGVTYFPDGSLHSLTMGKGDGSNGKTVTYSQTRDKLLNTIGVSDNVLSLDYDYDSVGNVIKVMGSGKDKKQLLNLNRSGFQYDGLSRLIGVTLPDGSYTYSYNDQGDITQKTSTADSCSYTYGYDPATSLLSAVTGSPGKPCPDAAIGVSYDELKNITGKNSQATEYAFNTKNQLIKKNGAEYARYDAMGNRFWSVIPQWKVDGIEALSNTPYLTLSNKGGKNLVEMDFFPQSLSEVQFIATGDPLPTGWFKRIAWDTKNGSNNPIVGMQVQFTTTSILPSGIAVGKKYYVTGIQKIMSTYGGKRWDGVSISETLNGPDVYISDVGSGTQKASSVPNTRNHIYLGGVHFSADDCQANKNFALGICGDVDDDGDGLSYEQEMDAGSYPFDTDSDNDGLTDGDEVARGTNPNKSDTDGDGLSDGFEIRNLYDPLVAGAEANADPDDDGLSNLAEVTNKTDPFNADSDFDSLSDGWEVTNGHNPRIADYQMGIGESHICALDNVGVKCWGDSSSNKTVVPTLDSPKLLAAIGQYSCAWDNTGLKCWGSVPSWVLMPPSNIQNPVSLVLSNYHACVLDDGGVKCWGAGTTNTGSGNEYGQSIVPALANPRQVVVGRLHTCALDDSGVKCWGENSAGQISVPPLNYVTQITAGSVQTCAKDDVGVKCWGNNNGGTLGQVNFISDPTVPSQMRVQWKSGGSSTGLANGMEMQFASVGTLPQGISANTKYFVINMNSQNGSFQISQSFGGAPLLFVNAGSGAHTISLYSPTVVRFTNYTAGYSRCVANVSGLVHCNNTSNSMPPVTYRTQLNRVANIFVGSAADCALDVAGMHCWNEYRYTNLAGLMPILQIDSDRDGLLDADEAALGTDRLNPDSDGDGLLDGALTDNCPSISNADQLDTDGDGHGEVCDAFPNDATEYLDTDGDGIGNNADTDDDNDGVPDVSDPLPLVSGYYAGILDKSFDTDGKKYNTVGAGLDRINAVIQQADGKLVAVGYTNSTATGDDFAIARYNDNGSLDTSFGSDYTGIVKTAVGASTANDRATAVIQQADGKLVVVGNTSSDGTAAKSNLAIVRYASNGSIDTSFNGGNVVVTDVSKNNKEDVARAVVLQPDQKILVIGYANVSTNSTVNYNFSIARYNVNGSLDTTGFGSAGIVTTAIGSGTTSDQAVAAAWNSYGRLIVVGNTGVGNASNFVVARYNINVVGRADGTLDSDFGGGNEVGFTTLDIASKEDVATSVAVQPDDNIVVAGYTNVATSGTDYNFVLTRFLDYGYLNYDFGINGVAKTAIGASPASDMAKSVVVLPDGKLVVAVASGTNTVALVKFNDSGELDTEFDDDGIVTTPFDSSTGTMQSMIKQVDGKFVVAGYSNSSGNDDFSLFRYLGDTDSDSDGLSDRDESNLGTNPLVKDTDGDGLNDGVESAMGSNPLLLDTDGDGVNDGLEVTNATSPINSADSFQISVLAHAGFSVGKKWVLAMADPAGLSLATLDISSVSDLPSYSAGVLTYANNTLSYSYTPPTNNSTFSITVRDGSNATKKGVINIKLLPTGTNLASYATDHAGVIAIDDAANNGFYSGGFGNDILLDGHGNDTLLFSKGSGFDIAYFEDATSNREDKLQLNSTQPPDTVRFAIEGDNLSVGLSDATDNLMLIDYAKDVYRHAMNYIAFGATVTNYVAVDDFFVMPAAQYRWINEKDLLANDFNPARRALYLNTASLSPLNDNAADSPWYENYWNSPGNGSIGTEFPQPYTSPLTFSYRVADRETTSSQDGYRAVVELVPSVTSGIISGNASYGRNETLSGEDSIPEVFEGFGGNDLLRTGDGSDTIKFNVGDGRDVVELVPELASGDTLQLGAGITQATTSFQRDGLDLLIKPTTTDEIRLLGFFANDQYTSVELGVPNGVANFDHIEFKAANGAQSDLPLDKQAIITKVKMVSGCSTTCDEPNTFVGTSGNDIAFGWGGNDILNGGSGDDQLMGDSGDDVLNPGSGNNWISGGAGADTYELDANSGNTTIENLDVTTGSFLGVGAPHDRIVMLSGVTDSQVQMLRSNMDLIVKINDGSNASTTRVLSFFDNPPYNFSELDIVINGVTWDGSCIDFTGVQHCIKNRVLTDALLDDANPLFADDILVAYDGGTIHGGDGNDHITGSWGDDVLYGDAGNDVIYSANGSADVIYGGDGNDTLEGGWGGQTLYGEDGDDTLIARGPYGHSALYGGPGNDLYQMADDAWTTIYTVGGTGRDTMQLTGLLRANQLWMEQQGDSLIIHERGSQHYFVVADWGNPDSQLERIKAGTCSINRSALQGLIAATGGVEPTLIQNTSLVATYWDCL